MLRIPPMFLMSGGLVAQALLPPSPGGPRWWQWGLSLPIALAGLALLFGSSMRFYRAGVSANPVDVERPRALVRDGVYRLTRNPMYVAMAAILAAHAVLRGPWAWLPARRLFRAARRPAAGSRRRSGFATRLSKGVRGIREECSPMAGASALNEHG